MPATALPVKRACASTEVSLWRWSARAHFPLKLSNASDRTLCSCLNVWRCLEVQQPVCRILLQPSWGLGKGGLEPLAFDASFRMQGDLADIMCETNFEAAWKALCSHFESGEKLQANQRCRTKMMKPEFDEPRGAIHVQADIVRKCECHLRGLSSVKTAPE